MQVDEKRIGKVACLANQMESAMRYVAYSYEAVVSTNDTLMNCRAPR